ncbi:ATP-binding protein [Tengunoibacter tsumagoiensis]|uniref:Orc1-like AAA ATPase domain-containing protein n=1 Tax=Tengunoibacter tsumagoiensis TaxID=2014871 RepID=A0A402A9F7_9CHLR|nr:ATP-binding protein [Tengunoibacter tsumagoiensis]GCE15759.1 hypothetical protein KTT_56180 [Tengunoibacter tsumagoiensis]
MSQHDEQAPLQYIGQASNSAVSNGGTANYNNITLSVHLSPQAPQGKHIHDFHSVIQRTREKFVGRQQERNEIRALIAQVQKTGGYVIIQGQAGQGKSSIIAKMIDEYGIEKVAHYFIGINPDPHEQRAIMCSLMEYLIRKHRLSETLIQNTEIDLLRIEFHNFLIELSAQGIQEVLFIDGLDQLLRNEHGERNLSFLPENLPQGIVCVIGTRPDDTIVELEALKPRRHYTLPPLTKSDFELLLKHYHVSLDEERCYQVYQSLQGALYLSLFANIVVEQAGADTEITQIIQDITEDPNNLFSRAIRRLQKLNNDWQAILKPILCLLTMAHSPLSIHHIHQIIGISSDGIKSNIQRLEGLLLKDEQHYGLYHMKLREFLQKPANLIFDEKDVLLCHKKLADWCEREKHPWEPEDRSSDQKHRNYARLYYITHLHSAQDWERLFEVLNSEEFARRRMHSSDLDTHVYAQDLDLGRQAIISFAQKNPEVDQITYLPLLWKCTLLRCSLTGKSTLYPAGTYRLLLLLDRKQEALGLVDLLTDKFEKAKALIEIAQELVMKPDTPKTVSSELLSKAQDLVCEIKDQTQEQGQLLKHVARLFTNLGQWQKAQGAAQKIEQAYLRAEGLRDIGDALAREGQLKEAVELWQQAIQIIQLRKNSEEKFQFNYEMGKVLARYKQDEQAQTAWLAALKSLSFLHDTRLYPGGYCSIINEVARTSRAKRSDHAVLEAVQTAINTLSPGPHKDRIVQALKELFFHRISLMNTDPESRAEDETSERENAHTSAIGIINLLKDKEQKAKSTYELAKILIQFNQWASASNVIDTIEKIQFKVQALIALGEALAVEQKREQALEAWTRAENVIQFSHVNERKIQLLHTLAQALTREQDDQQPQTLWKEIERQVNALQTSSLDGESLWRLGSLFSMIQQPEKAFVLRKQAQQQMVDMPNSDQKYQLWHTQAHFLIETREWEQTEELLLQIVSSYQWTDMSNELIVKLLHQQQWEIVQSIITAIKDVQIQSQLSYLSANSAKLVRNWDQALHFSTSIELIDLRVQALCELWLEVTRQRQIQWAQRVQQCIEKTIIARKKKRTQRDQARYQWSKALLAAHQYRQAQSIISAISEPLLRAEALIELWNTLLQGEHQRRVQFVWSSITKIMPTLQSGEQANSLLRRISEILANRKQWAQADRFIQTIDDEAIRAQALQSLGKALALAHDWKRAKAVIETIENSHHKVVGLHLIAHEYQRGRPVETAYPLWEQAKKLIGAIEDIEQRDHQYLLALKFLLQAQQWKQARAIIALIANASQRDEASLLCLEAIVQEKQWKQMLLVIDNIPSGIVREQARLRAAKALYEAKEPEQACDILKHIRTSELPQEEQIEVWELLISLGETKKAQSLWNLLHQNITDIADHHQRAQGLHALAVAATHVRQWEQVQRLIDSLGYTKKHIDLFCQIGSAAQRVYYKEQASAAWEKAEQAIDNLNDLNERLRARCLLGEVLTQAQEQTKANGVWSKTVQIMYTEPGLSLQSLCLLARVLTQSQRKRDAELVWEQAEKNIATLQTQPEAYRENLYYIGEAYARLNMNERAETIWLKAECTINILDSSEQQLLFLEKLAEAFARIEQYASSQRCLEKIIQYLDTMQEATQKQQYLQDLLKKLVNTRQWRSVCAIINMIGDMRLQKSLWRLYASDLLVAQQWDSLPPGIFMAMSNQLELNQLCEIVEALIKAERYDQACDFVDAIKENGKRSYVLCRLGIALVQAKQMGLLKEIWQKLEETITSLQANHQLIQQALREIAQALAQAQRWTDAEQLIASITDPWQQVQCLVVLGEAYTKRKQPAQKAQDTWSLALDVLEERIGSQRERAQGLILIAKAFTKVGREEEAEALWEKAESIIKTMKDKDWQSQVLHTLAENLAQVRQWDRADSVIATITVQSLRARALGRLVEELIRQNDLKRAEAVSEKIQDEEQLARALVLLEGAYATKNAGKAQEMGNRANSVLNEMLDKQKMVEPLSARGRFFSLQRRSNQANNSCWNQARDIIERMPAGQKRSWAIRSLGYHLASAEKQEELLCLLQQSWSEITTREDANILFPLVSSIIVHHPSLGIELYDTFHFVNRVLKEA